MRYTVFVQVCPVAGIPDHNVGGTLRYLTVWTNHDCAVVGQTAADRTVNANHAIVGQRHIIVDGEGFTRRDFQPLAAGDRLDRFKGGSAINLSIVPLEDYTAPVRFLILAVVTDGGRDNKDIAGGGKSTRSAVSPATDARAAVISAGCGHSTAVDLNGAACAAVPAADACAMLPADCRHIAAVDGDGATSALVPAADARAAIIAAAFADRGYFSAVDSDSAARATGTSDARIIQIA